MGSRLLPAATVGLFAVAGGVTALLAGAPTAAAVPVGAGVGGLVWAAHAVTGRLTRPAPSASARPATGRSDSPDADRPADASSQPPADAARWLTRAAAAADRLENQCRQSPKASLWPALATAATSVRAAADRLTTAAEAVRVIDTSGTSADQHDLDREQERLEKEARALPDGPLRRAKQDAARATGQRAATLKRLTDLRQLLITTMEATALRLEAAAERGAMLLSLQAATEASAVPTDLTALDHELEAVQAGLDTLDEVTRSLHGTADEPPE
ncbi:MULTISPECIES: hypothetical protein [unclassified Streptomyces]|uniref:hypothetical protein n=1 Tax=unclassified Streptomyces TaxID=2593676 RepID=UPI002DDB35BD|nr:hypothetical protein [Streptomyces sp. NBC_00243]WRZ25511.1 hypothetical protein OHT59_46850 [Streptomyces sp. NBC_00243]